MEIKKEDFVKFHIVNTHFYALPVDYFKEKKVEMEVEIVEEVIVPVPLTQEEVDAIAKAKEIEDLKAKLLALEE